jgi:hypothetical protein
MPGATLGAATGAATQQTELPDAVEDAAGANSGEHQQVQKLTKSKKAETH